MSALLFVALISYALGADELKLAILMFRHGDRSPINTIPNDIYTTASWPEGGGQLSKVGMTNHLRNGRYYRERYTDESKATYLGLDGNYKREQVHVRSTDVDRTLMSAESMLAGIFPSNDSTLPLPLDIWQPIPVHTVSLDIEPLLDGTPTDQCPKFAKTIQETVKSSPVFKKFWRSHTEDTKKILNITGYLYDSNVYNMFTAICTTQDVLFCEMAHNFTIKPDFVEDGLYDLVFPYAAFRWRMFTDVMSQEQQALCGGVLLNELKERVQNSINGSDKLKLILYSGHDTTLSAILTTLGIFDGIQPPYATVLMLELWKLDNGTHQVRFHKHNHGNSLITYTLPGCNEVGCTVQEFENVNKDLQLTEDEFHDICFNESDGFLPGLPKEVILVLLCISIILLLGAVAAFTLVFYRHKVTLDRYYSSEEYKPLSEEEETAR